MAAKGRLRGHPLHPMLIVFPLGLWLFGYVAIIIYWASGLSFWQIAANASLGAGTIGAFVAMIPGFLDYIAMGNGYVRQLGTRHMTVNLIATAAFLAAWLFVATQSAGVITPFVLGTIGSICALIGGWLGGEMVYVRVVGVSAKLE